MKRSAYILISVGVVLSLSSVLFLRGRERPVKAAAAIPSSISHEGLIAAPGRVEAVSEEIRVSS